MRILWFSYYYLPHVGGGTWATYYLSKELAGKGHDVHLLVPNVRYKMAIDGEASGRMEEANGSASKRVPRLPLPNALGPFASFLPMLLEGIRLGKRADVIVCQYHPHHLVTFCGLVVGKILNKPVVARADDTFRSMGLTLSIRIRLISILNIINESLIPKTSTFFVVSEYARGCLLEKLGDKCPRDKIGVSYNGYDAANFIRVTSIDEAKKRLSIPKDRKVILFIGRFTGEEYGANTLLEAFRLVRFEEPSAFLLLLGDNVSDALKIQMTQLGIETNVMIVGPRPHNEVPKFIATADVCIGPLMPTEALPMKVLEYMACGKPVVTGEGSVLEDLDPRNSLVVTKNTPEAVSEAILRIFRDEAFAIRVGMKAQKVAARFTWANIAGDLERKLVEVAG